MWTHSKIIQDQSLQSMRPGFVPENLCKPSPSAQEHPYLCWAPWAAPKQPPEARITLWRHWGLFRRLQSRTSATSTLILIVWLGFRGVGWMKVQSRSWSPSPQPKSPPTARSWLPWEVWEVPKRWWTRAEDTGSQLHSSAHLCVTHSLMALQPFELALPKKEEERGQIFTLLQNSPLWLHQGLLEFLVWFGFHKTFTPQKKILPNQELSPFPIAPA